VKLRLGIGPGGKSDDGRFCLSVVECLGMCGRAPAMMIGDECFDGLTKERVDEILEGLGVR
jgi:NADH:ubiquinone oxidoreductase subunit E